MRNTQMQAAIITISAQMRGIARTAIARRSARVEHAHADKRWHDSKSCKSNKRSCLPAGYPVVGVGVLSPDVFGAKVFDLSGNRPTSAWRGLNTSLLASC